MSDCISAGKSFEYAMKEMNTECPKGKPNNWKKRHKWVDGPYGIKECVYCGKTVYWT